MGHHFFSASAEENRFCEKTQNRLDKPKILWYNIKAVRSGCGAAGSALPWGGRGRKFKSCHSDQNKAENVSFRLYFFAFGGAIWGICGETRQWRWRLTTCLTIVGDHMSEFGAGAGRLGWLFFDYAVQILSTRIRMTPDALSKIHHT